MKLGFAAGIFIAGLAAGWLMRGGIDPPGFIATPTGPATKSSRIRHPDSKREADEAKWANFGQRMQGLDDDALDREFKKIASQDRLVALYALASHAGLNGVSHPVKQTMQKILQVLTDEDYSSAWATAQNTSDRDLRTFMLATIADRLSDKNPELALELELEQAAADPGFVTSAASKFMTSKLKVGAAEYVEALKRFPLVGSSSGSDEEFAPGFDFQMVADNLAELMNGHENENLNPRVFPTNFYTEWAKKDPESAFKAWSTNPPVPCNDLNGIMAALEQKSPGSSAEWIAAKLQDPNMPRDKIIQELGSGATDGLPARIAAIVDAMPDQTQGDAFLADFAATGTGGHLELYGFAISYISSPEQRLQAFRKMKENNVTPDLGKIDGTQLQAWEVTREQIQEIFAK